MKRALILVDIQYDFCPGGALAVPKGNEVVEIANLVVDKKWDRVIATQDWHPAEHQSFASNHPGKQPYEGIDLHGLPQVLWPAHCIQGTRGSEFHDNLDVERVHKVIQKGTDPKVDSYSGFLDNGGRNDTGLDAYLKSQGITDVYVMGLATDYCVKFTALDALKLGYRTFLIQDGCRGVNINPDDSAQAIADMVDAGVIPRLSHEVLTGCSRCGIICPSWGKLSGGAGVRRRRNGGYPMSRKTPASAITSHKIADSLYLVNQTIGNQTAEPAKPVEIPTDHIMMIDCSGSMYNDLPRIREQLKKKLAKMLRPADTISFVWFSGRGQCGVLLESEPVATLADLSAVHQAIDRWLKPVGMTGFKEPLELMEGLAGRLAKKNPNNARALTFMSDGCDNQWSRADVLKAVEKAAGVVATVTIVEYGYYADRPLLTAMAEKAGGALIFSEDFDKYMPIIEGVFQKKVSGAKRVQVKIDGDAIGGFVYALVDGDLVTFAVEGGAVAVPEDFKTLSYLSPTPVGQVDTDLGVLAKQAQGDRGLQVSTLFDTAYAAISLFAIRMKPDVVYPILKALGDVRFIEQFSSCFGKQKYSDFMETAKTAALGSGRYDKGYDPNKVPRDDAFTVLDVLNLLQEDEHARVMLDNPAFKYSRIGRGRVDATDQLTDAESEEMQQLSAALAAERSPAKIKDITAKIAAITANKVPPLQFNYDKPENGYPFLSLTFNEDRPNVSFLTKRTGTLDLSGRITPEFKDTIPTTFPSFQYRNYAVIKDGLVNIDSLPVMVSETTFRKLVDEKVIGTDPADKFVKQGDLTLVHLNLKALPVINRKMVKATSAKSFFTTQYELSKSQAAQKVYNAYVKDMLPARKSEGYAAKYGEAGATWLKEQGITDYNGFQPPHTKQAEATDFYMGKELKVSLKGLSKLPSLKEAKEQMAKNKLNASGTLMVETVKEVESFLASSFYKKAGNQPAVLEAWLDGQAKAAKAKTRGFIFEIAKVTFCIVVGQAWFSEFASIDENEMEIDTGDGQKLACKAEMREIEIKI